jgi:hypothetical protein
MKAGKRRRKEPPAGGPSSEKPQASSKDVDYWLGVFGNERGEKD